MNDLKQIKLPVLIVHGEHDYIVPELAYMTRDNLPNAKLVMMRNCSHMTFYENPEKYTKVVLDFLNQ